MILKLLSRLIDYPCEELHDHKADLLALVASDDKLPEDVKAPLCEFIEQRLSMDLLDWQAEYDGLFERGRSLSLLFFEHVHGESRDRGQAMIDLIEQYKLAGLNIGVRELPDYVPLYLEFVATQPIDAQAGWLQDVAHIMALLTARLQKRENNYQAVFAAVLALSGVEVELAEIHQQIADEKRDDTKEAIDKVWEEEAVTFGGDAVNGGCPTTKNRPSAEQSRSTELPISFVDATANSNSHNQVRGNL
ncbi:nitrate reductase molybdenum cofactor assembly chaperone [Pseudoalteromonas haloplanktis]|uniref:Nitrate reductase molybdenum cofactor assembly chaperone n=1 Tax=Pseudoalteromonas haloplanktis TaxID=228 RepID=A0ABU1B6Z9_PSEHA|nr:nitrate reductase molybdenum cofactor assembly chaperone [Pseudoalteromonas haloplanktis]MDQ9090145.1 nitrate reductase molybdenum cofactor assembly chaperone [Pseudoalteromonas haloplanktis]